jgi:hypothetical protein
MSYRVSVAGSKGRDPAKPLQEVEGDSFAGQETARRAFDDGHAVAGLKAGPRGDEEFNLVDTARLAIDQREQIKPGDDERLTRNESSGSSCGLVDTSTGGEVAATDVLSQCEAD